VKVAVGEVTVITRGLLAFEFGDVEEIEACGAQMASVTGCAALILYDVFGAPWTLIWRVTVCGKVEVFGAIGLSRDASEGTSETV
jgi:hypothetical protein